MASPINNNNLGYKVTTRNFSWRDLVLREWGSEWTVPDTAYEFSSGAKYQSSDLMNGGPYQK